MMREYPAHPLVGIGTVILRGPTVLLVRRGKAPSIGSWSIPGGAQEVGETVEAAARRELLEETGLQVGAMHLLTFVDSIHRDPTGRVQYHYTILDFGAEWVGGEPVPGSDVTDARFFPFDGLAPLKLWSEAHRVIGLARARLALR